MIFTLEGRVPEVIHPVLVNLHCMLQLMVLRRPLSIILSLQVISRLLPLHRDLLLTPGLVMDVERLDIIGNILQGRVTDPQ